MQRTRRLALAALLASLMSVFLLGGAASAHVTVQPPEVEQGGFAKLTFRVPNELPDASTVGLRVQLPQDAPFTSVSVKPKAGWTAQVTKRTLDTPLDNHGEQVTEVASEVTWTGGEIKPGEFDEFEISVGRLPTDVDELFFPAIQTYSNGEEVSWIDKPDASGEEPESPAPELKLVAASGDGDHHDDDATATAISTPESDTGESAAASSDDHDDSSQGLAILALVVGGLAIVLSIVAIATRAKKPSASA